jgi:hypothetical protein
MEALNAHEAHTLAKKEKIEPTALNDQVACGADGREVWWRVRPVATKPGLGK